MNGEELCKMRGYHTWADSDGTMNIRSDGETFNEIDIVVTCTECDAEASGTIDWSVY
jgi:hypothetical protein